MHCDQAKASVMKSNLLANWVAFKKAMHKAKRKHFDEHINDIAHTNLQPWDLMDWVSPRKTPPIEAISYQSVPCTSMDQLWNTLHSTFNSALDRPIDLSVLGDKWEFPSIRAWILYSAAEMLDALMGTSNRSAPGPDHITWHHLKCIVCNGYMSRLFLWLANTCLQSSHWPAEFKASTTVVIPKPGKLLYGTPKLFCPSVLLNTLGKMFEKMLSNRLQFKAGKHGVLHPNQFGGVYQNSTEDAGCFLTHVVQQGWYAKLKASVVTFGLAQFFPSINHDVLLSILDKQGFAPEVVVFFKSYLVDLFTCYTWDDDLSLEFPSSVGVGQGSALSPILLALCLAPLLKEFECRVHMAVLISYVNDSTIIVQSDTWGKNLVKLKLAYKIMFELTQSMGLVLKHSKSEGFHFSQKHSDSNPDIDLGYAPYTGATPPHPGTTWQYLGFFFDCALTFQEHVKCYTNRALTTVRAMFALGNSVCGLWPRHKQMLYCACVLPIAMYGSRLWLYKGVAMKGPLDSLWKMQRCACLWITSTFKTSPMGAVETLVGMPLIHLHVKKLVERSHICTHMLQASHVFCRLVDGDHKFSVKTLKGQI
jgi:hypothetical protein